MSSEVFTPTEMIRWKTVPLSLYARICHCHLFTTDADEYEGDDNGQQDDPAVKLKHQQYATWLYILFLIGKRDMFAVRLRNTRAFTEIRS